MVHTSKRKPLLLNGGAHPELAEGIAKELGLNLVDAEISKFADGETSVKIADNVRAEDVFVIQPTGTPSNENIMNALLIIDALQRASAGRITAVMPYFGYARQDRKEASRVPISAKLVANLLEAAGVDRLLSVDLHAHQIQGFTDLPFDHLYARSVLAAAVKADVDKPVVVAPDVGASKMAKGYAKLLDTDWAIVDKDRIDDRTTHIAAVIGTSVKNRNAVIVDDIVSTAGSLLNAADALKAKGAKTVVAVISHGVLCGGAVGRIDDSSLDKLYVTNSLPEVEKSEKISRVTIAPLLAKAIASIHKGESVSELF